MWLDLCTNLAPSQLVLKLGKGILLDLKRANAMCSFHWFFIFSLNYASLMFMSITVAICWVLALLYWPWMCFHHLENRSRNWFHAIFFPPWFTLDPFFFRSCCRMRMWVRLMHLTQRTLTMRWVQSVTVTRVRLTLLVLCKIITSKTYWSFSLKPKPWPCLPLLSLAT